MFSRVLIANRGEIAVRIIARLPRDGHRDRRRLLRCGSGAPHVALADRAVRIGPAASRESYLDRPRDPRRRRAGGRRRDPSRLWLPLREREFAARVRGRGLTFVGPPAAGDRAPWATRPRRASRASRRRRAGGARRSRRPADGATAARGRGEVGCPLLIKAAAGGGGKGMRIVRDAPASSTSARGGATRSRTRRSATARVLRRAAHRARRATSRSRSSADTHGASCTCSSASARCSAAIRR